MSISPEATALLTEHLSWTPLTLVDDIINTMNALLYKSVEAVESFMINSAPPSLGFHPPTGTIPDTDDAGNILYSPSELEEIENGIHQLETLLENTIDKNFDRFELFVLRNILNVPEDLVGWVRLKHHENLDFSGSSQRKIDQPPAHEEHVRLRTLRQRLLASQALNIKLHAEAAKNERAIAQLRAMVSASEPSQFSFLVARAKETSEASAFAISQMTLIRSLVDQLKKKYSALLQQQRSEILTASAPAAGAKDGDEMDVDVEEGGGEEKTEKGTPEEERRRFIEKMARRHIEVSRDLRLDATGEILGDYEVDGVLKEDLGDVEALESFVEKVRGDLSNVE
ncbi:hypothetical protein RUND412_004307 [Rhizina undulata]